MNREQLEHLLRAASDISGERTLLVIGSQSVLGTFDYDELPAVATMSMEADVGFFNDPGGQKADHVESLIGEGTSFDQTNGYFIDGVDASTALLPHGWWDRLVDVNVRRLGADGARGQCLEPHDCALSKLAAGRQKDLDFVGALLDARLIHADVLLERIDTMDVSDLLKRRMHDWVVRYG